MAAACLCLPATAHAEPPINDTPGGALEIAPFWTGFLAAPQFKIADGGAGVEDWTNASVNDVEDPAPTCLGDQGFRSLWYKVNVPEPAVLRVTVKSTVVDRYQPVVTIHAPVTSEELGCGLGGTNSSTSPLAVASAYAHTGEYLIRVAQAENYAPVGGGPQVVISVVARDVAPPKISILAGAIEAPDALARYSAEVEDKGSDIDASSATWVFCDPLCNPGKPGTAAAAAPEDRLKRDYRWTTPGLRKVQFQVKDLAGNVANYSWVVYVRDPDPPVVKFSTTLPTPGSRRVRVTITHDESVTVKLLVTQQRASGIPQALFSKLLTMYWYRCGHAPPCNKSEPAKSMQTTRRTILLRPFVGSGSLVISGVARDKAGNATLLPTCVIDPVLGAGKCFSPDPPPPKRP